MWLLCHPDSLTLGHFANRLNIIMDTTLLLQSQLFYVNIGKIKKTF